MKDSREEWYCPESRVSVVFVDAQSAAQALANGHLCGPASAYCLSKALAAAALLAAETSEPDETLCVQMKCDGPLGGFNVECTSGGGLRGYTEKKILDDFDGLGIPDEAKIIGKRRIQVTRSIPGKILSQGIAASLDGYLAGSLQRRARIFLEASVGEAGEVLECRGLLIEALPDSPLSVSEIAAPLDSARGKSGILAVSQRTMLSRLDLAGAVRKRTVPLAFACRCSPERAAAMLAAVPPEERASMPPAIDVTCHMCGRTFRVSTDAGGEGKEAAS